MFSVYSGHETCSTTVLRAMRTVYHSSHDYTKMIQLIIQAAQWKGFLLEGFGSSGEDLGRWALFF